MKKELPKLSIIIPCFNSEKTLEEAFFSIINSSMSVDFEVVLVDDFSTDNTVSIINNISKKHDFSALVFKKRFLLARIKNRLFQ